MATKKINITVDIGLLEKVDKAAEKLFLSRSAYISMVLAERVGE